MLFLDWHRVWSVAGSVAAIVACGWILRNTRAKGRPISIPSALVALPMGVAGVLVLSLFAAGQLSGCDTHSKPVYSPNGTVAARVENLANGATGGNTAVVVYTEHGFSTQRVFFGQWKSVEAKDLEWIDGTHLRIHYDYSVEGEESKECGGTREVHVECVAKARP